MASLKLGGVEDRTRKTVLILAMILLATSIVVPTPHTVRAASLGPHQPILIVGDSGFATCNCTSSGNGSSSSPWIIEGWEITNTSTTFPSGIHIVSTRAYFQVANVYVHPATTATDTAGIFLEDVMNGKVENSKVRNSLYGIWVSSGSRNIIQNNDVSDNSYGLYLTGSSNNYISNNQANDNIPIGTSGGYGIWVTSSSTYNTLTGNNASNNQFGMVISGESDHNLFEKNQVLNNYYYGFHTTFASYNLYRNNTIALNQFGIIFFYTSYNNATGNHVVANQYGMGLEGHNGNDTFTGNLILNNLFGIYIFNSVQNMVYNNYIQNPLTSNPVAVYDDYGLAADQRIKYVDTNGNNAWDLGESVVYDSNSDGYYNATIDPKIKFVDTDNNGVWDAGETVVYDSNNNGKYDTTATTSEPIISGTQPANQTLLNSDLKFRFLDDNNNGVWNPGETIVRDSNSNNVYDNGEPVVAGSTPSPGTLLSEPVIAGPIPAIGAVLKTDPKIKYNDSNRDNLWSSGPPVEPVVYDSNSDGVYDPTEPLIAGSPPTPNAWNVGKTIGSNILGGPFLGGNYYSDYGGTDADADGIGDSPYKVSGGNLYDLLPLVPTTSSVIHDIAITSFTVTPQTVKTGGTVNISIGVVNQGTVPETFTVRAFYNNTRIGSRDITSLSPFSPTTVTLQWDTTGLSPGHYEVMANVTVVAGEGNTANNVSPTIRVSIVADLPPTASFTSGTSPPFAGQPVALDASASQDPDGSISQYSWSFGDGTPVVESTMATTSHTFDSAGTYSITLTVTDNQGITGTVSKTVSVSTNKPGAPKNLVITATSSQSSLTWQAPDTNGGSAITSYKIYRGTTPGQFSLIATLGNVLTYKDNNVESGKTYYYKVAAANAAAEGQPSDVADVLVPNQTGTLNAPGFLSNYLLPIIVAALVVAAAGMAIFLRSRPRRP